MELHCEGRERERDQVDKLEEAIETKREARADTHGIKGSTQRIGIYPIVELSISARERPLHPLHRGYTYILHAASVRRPHECQREPTTSAHIHTRNWVCWSSVIPLVTLDINHHPSHKWSFNYILYVEMCFLTFYWILRLCFNHLQ